VYIPGLLRLNKYSTRLSNGIIHWNTPADCLPVTQKNQKKIIFFSFLDRTSYNEKMKTRVGSPIGAWSAGASSGSAIGTVGLAELRWIVLCLLGLGYVIILFCCMFQEEAAVATWEAGPYVRSPSSSVTTAALSHQQQQQEQHNYHEDQQQPGGRDQMERMMHALKVGQITTPVIQQPQQHSSTTTTSPGVIVLGMHRSGTSVLGGLLVQMGLKTGGPLIPPAKDNEKGFFERIDVVLQNDAFMTNQHMYYAKNTYKYNPQLGLELAQKAIKEGRGQHHPHQHQHPQGEFQFAEGFRALEFLNSPQSIPYMLKDPRLCITLSTWLPLLANGVPAMVFTYRHPLDVALSMNKRETEHFLINHGLRLWYVYNKRAIQQSSQLCRVLVSHRRIMQHPKDELDRLYNELVTNCKVPIPHKISTSQIDSFIDTSLQHGKSTLQDETCVNKEYLSPSFKPPATWPTQEKDHIRLYREVMRVYCAFEDGSAFESSFTWDESIQDN
jgi:hypothetical protein